MSLISDQETQVLSDSEVDVMISQARGETKPLLTEDENQEATLEKEDEDQKDKKRKRDEIERKDIYIVKLEQCVIDAREALCNSREICRRHLKELKEIKAKIGNLKVLVNDF